MIAGFLHRELVSAFGAGEVFYASRRIALGDLFDQEILTALHGCEALLAVIGPRWLAAVDARGARKLDDEQDWVRREIVIALAASTRVIPILVEGAVMPTANQLPPDMRDLVRRNYVRLGHRRGEADAATVVSLLRETIPRLATARPPAGQTRQTSTHVQTSWEGQAIMPVPQQLPGDVRGFVNRLADLERLDALLDKDADREGTVSVCLIVGTAGVGKTCLTVHWAHGVRSHFTDGQLYINLHGYDLGEPVTPAQALAHFLEALGIAPGSIPADVEARASLYRSLLADRRMLVLLDNAATVAQIRPLLPGAGRCLALVTSRSRLSGLVARDGAERVTLEVFDEPAAIELLQATTAGYRASDDEIQVAELARLCARLPLALRIAAERAAARPHFSLDALIQDLRDKSSLWEALSSDDDDEADTVRTVFAWSYRALPEPAARLFRLLGLHPTPEFSTAAAAAAGALPVARTQHLLDVLVGAHLLGQTGPDRWQFHDLLRAYAVDESHHRDTPDEQRAVVHRILTWYLHTVAAMAEYDFEYGAPGIRLETPGDEIQPLRFATQREALSWFYRERANLVAAVQSAISHGLDRLAWQLPALLWQNYAHNYLFEDWFTATRLGLQAARRSDELAGTALIRTSLGMACRQSHQLAEAAEHHREAYAICSQTGNVVDAAWALNLLGRVEVENHHMVEACQYYEQCVAVFRKTGHELLTGKPLSNLAWAFQEFGRPDDALELCPQALEILRRTGDRAGIGDVYATEASAYLALGELDLAFEQVEASLATARDVGILAWEAHALIIYGRIQQASGRIDQALVSYQRSANIHRRLGIRFREALALDAVGTAYWDLGRVSESVHFHRQALSIHRDLDARWDTAVTLDHLAHALDGSNAPDEARAGWRECLSLLAEFEDPKAHALRTSIQATLGDG